MRFCALFSEPYSVVFSRKWIGRGTDIAEPVGEDSVAVPSPGPTLLGDHPKTWVQFRSKTHRKPKKTVVQDAKQS